MAVTQVLIDSVNPGMEDVDIQWESDQIAQTAMVYVAKTQADLADPAKRVEGALPTPVLDTVFRLTVPNIAAGQQPLSAGSQYVCQCECDGVMSSIETFTTVAPNVVHLRKLDAEPNRVAANGGVSKLSLLVRKNKQGVPNVAVTFTLPGGCNGQLGPVGGAPTGSTFLVNSDANGCAEAAFTSGSDKGKFRIGVNAVGAVHARKVRVIVKKP